MIFYIAMDNFLFGTIWIKRTKLRDLPVQVQVCSYLMVFVPMLCIPAYAVYKLIITPGKTFDEVRFSFEPRKIGDREQFSSLASATSSETRRAIT